MEELFYTTLTQEEKTEFDERMGICFFDGKMKRAEAEVVAVRQISECIGRDIWLSIISCYESFGKNGIWLRDELRRTGKLSQKTLFKIGLEDLDTNRASNRNNVLRKDGAA